MDVSPAGGEDVSNWELAVAACFLEGGMKRLVHTEDVAIRAFGLAPRRFCWRKYPDRIDLDIVRVSLTDAAKEKNGALVQGSKESGWSLTRAGMQWITRARKDLPRLLDGEPVAGQDRRSAQAQASDREAERLRQSEAFSKWASGRKDRWTVYDFFKATRTSEYLPPAKMSLRHTQLAALIAGDDQLIRFVDELFGRFEATYREGIA